MVTDAAEEEKFRWFSLVELEDMVHQWDFDKNE